MQNINYVSNLRLRASYGINGTLPSCDFGWRPLVGYSNQYMEQAGGGIAHARTGGHEHNAHPPGGACIALGRVRAPAVQRVAPALPRGTEVIGRHARNGQRLAGRVLPDLGGIDPAAPGVWDQILEVARG